MRSETEPFVAWHVLRRGAGSPTRVRQYAAGGRSRPAEPRASVANLIPTVRPRYDGPRGTGEAEGSLQVARRGYVRRPLSGRLT